MIGGRERLEDFSIFCNHRIVDSGKFPLGPVVRTPHTAEGMSSVPDSLTREIGSLKLRDAAKNFFLIDSGEGH